MTAAAARCATVACLLVAAPAAAQDAPLGRSAAFGELENQESVLVAAETPLRTHPDRRAARLAIVGYEIELPVLERRGDWVRTRFGDVVGWLAPRGEPSPEPGVPLIDAARELLVVDVSEEERAARIARARARLDGENRRWRALGPWPLHTDVADDELLAYLDAIADRLPGAYERRFGLAPDVDDLPVVVLFARERNYREFAAVSAEVAGLEADGHASHSLAAFFVGRSPRGELAAVMVHELTHLLNRSLYPVQPHTWLEEGLANDLGLARIDDEGNIEAGSLGGTTVLSTRRTSNNAVSMVGSTSGGRVVWMQLLQDWKVRRSRLAPLPELLELPWADFVRRERRSANYALSTFFVRFLLDAGPEGSADAFRAFLREVADGGASDGEALSAALGMSIDDLAELYGQWLTVQVARFR